MFLDEILLRRKCHVIFALEFDWISRTLSLQGAGGRSSNTGKINLAIDVIARGTSCSG